MRSRFLLSLVALTVVAAACGGGGGTVSAKHKQQPTTTTGGPQVAPLTGLPDPTGQSLTKPALSVKIENAPESRPQTGIQSADVVYEQIVEGGITRFLAVFNSSIPPVVGPVRSGRAMDPDLTAPLGGIFAYSGGIQQTEDAINAAPGGVHVIVDTGSDPALFRDKTKIAPHNLYGKTDLLLAKGGKPTPPPPLFLYTPAGVPFSGDNVNAFSIKYDPQYGAPTYTWDPASGTWKRSIGLAPFTTTDGGQVAPNNVVVQFVGSYLQSPESGNFNTIGNGDAWVFSNGKVVKGKWARTDRTKPISYTDANGLPIRLTPGRTWVEFAPSISVFNGVDIVPGAPTPTTLPAPTTPTTKKKK